MSCKCMKTKVSDQLKPMVEIPFCKYRHYRPEYYEAATLLELSARVYDAIPPPPQWYYTPEEIAEWLLSEVGHPEFREAFIINDIDGKEVMYLEADKFPRISIRRFHIIKELTAKIREVFKLDQREARSRINVPHRIPHYELLNHWNRIPPFMPWCPHVMIGNIRRVNPMTGTTQRQNFNPKDHPYLLKEDALCVYHIPCGYEFPVRKETLMELQMSNESINEFCPKACP